MSWNDGGVDGRRRTVGIPLLRMWEDNTRLNSIQLIGKHHLLLLLLRNLLRGWRPPPHSAGIVATTPWGGFFGILQGFFRIPGNIWKDYWRFFVIFRGFLGIFGDSLWFYEILGILGGDSWRGFLEGILGGDSWRGFLKGILEGDSWWILCNSMKFRGFLKGILTVFFAILEGFL